MRWASSRGGPTVSHLLALPSSLGAKSARKPIEMWRQQANLFEDVPDLLKFFCSLSVGVNSPALTQHPDFSSSTSGGRNVVKNEPIAGLGTTWPLSLSRRAITAVQDAFRRSIQKCTPLPVSSAATITLVIGFLQMQQAKKKSLKFGVGARWR